MSSPTMTYFSVSCREKSVAHDDCKLSNDVSEKHAINGTKQELMKLSKTKLLLSGTIVHSCCFEMIV